MENSFLKAAMHGDTVTENGAMSNSTTMSELADQFSSAGAYRGRDMGEVFTDQSALWAENPLMALRFPFYLRAVTRNVKKADGTLTEKVVKGQGQKDEALKRYLWIAKYHEESFYKNVFAIPIVGSWRDVWQLMLLDTEGILDKEKLFELLDAGLYSENQTDLVKKYMPRIRSTKKCVTDSAKKLNELAKEYAKHLGLTYEAYRILKKSGKAHLFQTLVAKKDYKNLSFNSIPGRALSIWSHKSDGLLNKTLEKKYLAWLKEQPVVKFKGYPYELLRSYFNNDSKINRITIDKQFDGLIELAKKDEGGIHGNVWCALDTSCSMSWNNLDGSGTTALHVCLSLGFYFSTLNTGAFRKNVIMFDNVSRIKKLYGNFCDMADSLKYTNAMGGTNFQSVIDEIIRVRKANPNVPLEDYPDTLLVVSDMQFNPVGVNVETNYEAIKRKLSEVFPMEFVNKFRCIWWDVTGRKKDYPSQISDGGTYVFSGFDGAIITLLLGGDGTIEDKETGEKRQLSMMEMIEKALSQEILSEINV